MKVIAAAENNGSISLWIDGVSKETVSGIDNDTLRVDEVRLGAAGTVDVQDSYDFVERLFTGTWR